MSELLYILIGVGAGLLVLFVALVIYFRYRRRGQTYPYDASGYSVVDFNGEEGCLSRFSCANCGRCCRCCRRGSALEGRFLSSSSSAYLEI